MKKYKLYVGGKFIESSTKKTFISVNPAKPKKIIGVFQKGSAQDVEKAVRAAEKAFVSWSQVPAPRRAEILLRTAQFLRQEKNRLGKLVTQEMGKQLLEGLADVQEAIDIAEYMAGEGRRLFGYTTPSEFRNKFCMTVRRPLGVVGLITPWNFPIAIPAWKLMPALICGNSIIIKPSSDTPLCVYELVAILEKAGLPKGVINIVTGSGNDVGAALVKHPRVHGISFTGSKEVGLFVTKHAGLKKVGLELGGKNAIIVMKDADLRLAIEGVVWGAFGTTGQRCTATSRVIVHKKIQKKFEQLLSHEIKKLSVGDGMTASVGPLINASALQKTEQYVAIGKKEGAKLIYGGKRIVLGNGYFYAPTVFTEVNSRMRIAQDEIFGPILSIMSFNTLPEAFAIANNVDYGLSSAIYTNDIRNAFLAIDTLESGITYINSSTIGAEVHLPFGGVKGTGNGVREAGIEGIHEFSETKTVYIDYSGCLQKAQIDEFVEK